MAAVRKSRGENKEAAEKKELRETVSPEVINEESGPAPREEASVEEVDIPEAYPAEAQAVKTAPSDKMKNRPRKLSPIKIALLVISAISVLAGYYMYNPGFESVGPYPGFDQETPLKGDTSPVPDPETAAEIDTAPVLQPETSATTDPKNLTAQEIKIGRDRYTAPDQEAVVKNDPNYNNDYEAANVIPEEEAPSSEEANQGPEAVAGLADERFIVHVSAWETKRYAESFKQKVISLYPNAVIIFENDHYIIMIPNITSREKALSTAAELAEKLDVSPLVYIQQRKIL